MEMDFEALYSRIIVVTITGSRCPHAKKQSPAIKRLRFLADSQSSHSATLTSLSLALFGPRSGKSCRLARPGLANPITDRHAQDLRLSL